MNKILSKSFTFEAAHKLTSTKKRNNENIHGHSFFVEVSVIDKNNNIEKNGMVLDLSILERKLSKIKKILDHTFLNSIKGLKNPTIENIAIWIWNKLKNEDINLYKVTVSRKSCGETFELLLN